ncbi:MAG: exodeoxyribonuclease III [Anaerolineae bacterium]
MLIATWNVNSIKVREARLLAWLAAAKPDVVCLQELKVQDDAFPLAAVEAAGYHAAFHGQKSYNGVAILARTPIEDVRVGLADGVDDPQARLIAGTVEGVRILSAYVPNGETVGSDKYAYKLAWLRRLRAHLAAHYRPDEPLALAGDFNVAPDDHDVNNAQRWAESVLAPRRRAAPGRHRRLGPRRRLPPTPSAGRHLVGGTTRPRASPATTACGSTTSGRRRRWRSGSPPPPSTASSARARARATTRRCAWPSTRRRRTCPPTPRTSRRGRPPAERTRPPPSVRRPGPPRGPPARRRARPPARC